jgi:DNA replication protein DnaC
MTSCAARLQPRRPIVERHEIMELLAQLKLAGMRAAYDEVVAAGVRAQHSFQRIFGELLLAQLADNRARSTAYRIGVARFPVMKNLAELDFSVSPVNQGVVRELHDGGLLATQRNAVLVGGTGVAT